MSLRDLARAVLAAAKAPVSQSQPLGSETVRLPTAPLSLTSLKPVSAAETDETELIEERAAILEFGAGMPRPWAEACARMMMLDRVRAPAGVLPGSWRRVCAAAVRLVEDDSAAHAAALGWKPVEFFGAHPAAPFSRYDSAGLVFFVEPGDLVEIDDHGAIIKRKSGATIRWQRRSEKRTEPALLLAEIASADAATSQSATSREINGRH